MMSDMETSIRGFSFMPGTEVKIKGLDLQYVEDSELERAWRSSRRERVKQQEEKIWNDFIEEQDIVRTVYESDPYQFIEQLSESCLNELLQNHLNKVQQKEKQTEEEANVKDEETPSPGEESPVSTESTEQERCDDENIFHLFHEDKDDEGYSGNEDVLNDSAASPLCTVREKQEEIEEQPVQIVETKPVNKGSTPEKDSCNSPTPHSTNINSVLENSIYCAKVKDLRVRISEEILSIITSLERLDIYNIDPDELRKMQKRSSEFTSRFSRIHVYQLQRQIHDLKRTSSSQLPYGQHTQLQAHMLRIVSMHQNLLQAYCGFHKSFSQTMCIGDGCQPGLVLSQLVREVPPPAQHAIRHLYADNLLVTCDKLDEALAKHNQRTADIIKSIEEERNENKSHRAKGKKVPGVKTSSRADGKLSMYSLDTLRINLKPKTSSTKNSLSSANKLTSTASKTSHKQAPKKATSPKVKRKSPIKVRPRRDDSDVRTMVEAVTASHVSLVPSALPSPTKVQTSRKVPTPRQKRVEASRKNQKVKKPVAEVIKKTESSRREPSESPKVLRSRAVSPVISTREEPDTSRHEKKYKIPDAELASAEVSRLLRELCGDTSGNKNERVSGAKNAQLHCVRTSSPRQHTTPQLLRILEETIQKKSPRSMNVRLSTIKDKEAEKYRMSFNISGKTVDNLFQYRTKYVQHMLTSAMYANSAVEKPWEMVNSVSDQIVDELLLKCAKEMELRPIIQRLYQNETKG
ncbi:PREDICTED: uncharacterized protein LOC106107619 isoform X2 [Papilio polytes]|uniref:uncharacterized protein LOC106107619 isoform X2 n=1 Tax=Papilio polytes TaxID=76194 RepID=UPI000675EED6|nr:PREDICTED: uncharacterized protein LOC106107619 isoform X2 [Papilio polytes]